MSDESTLESDDQTNSPKAFFQAIASSKFINTIMNQAVYTTENISLKYNTDTKFVPAWQLAIIKRNFPLIKIFIEAGLRISECDGGMDIFRNFVYCNDEPMTKVLLRDPSIVQELNRDLRYLIIFKKS